METSRVSRSERRAEGKRKSGFPQLAPAPEDYPVFPDTSTWPVVFPPLPPAPDGGPRRPPQHVSKAAAPSIPLEQLPNHVAIVMDGNGRWATQRDLPRVEGHKMGEAVVIDIVCGAIEIGIKWLSLYAFSTENWKRSADEVRFLMGFNRDVVRRRRVNLNEMGVKIRWVGSRPRLWRRARYPGLLVLARLEGPTVRAASPGGPVPGPDTPREPGPDDGRPWPSLSEARS